MIQRDFHAGAHRSAVVVIPKQPFLDWLHRVDPTSGRLRLGDLERDPGIYLLPEYIVGPEVEGHLEEVCEEIFEDQLAFGPKLSGLSSMV